MPAIDHFKDHPRVPAGGPANLALVTPDDANDLGHVCQWVYVASGGTLRVTTKGGQTLTTPVLLPGWHLMELRRILATGTTATGLMVGW